MSRLQPFDNNELAILSRALYAVSKSPSLMASHNVGKLRKEVEDEQVRREVGGRSLTTLHVEPAT